MRKFTQRPSAKILFLLFALFSVVSLSANGTTPSIFDLLSFAPGSDINAARKVILRLPMDSIYAKSNQEQYAVLSFIDDTGRDYRRSLKVGVRGKFRRHTCTFPPLKLNFSKKDLKADGLAKHDKLKLVTPCFEDELGQQLILKEYLAYKIYEQLHPAAFRTQLLEITYRDIHRHHPDQTVYAFILEDNDELAERLGGVELENGRGLAPDRFDRRAETTQALFSFLIGNHDWNLAMARNLKMVELPGGTVLPVPYDFDFSNLVNAPYRRLNSAIGQLQPNQRVYMGLLCDNAVLETSFARFVEQRKAIQKMIRGFWLLPDVERHSILDYLSTFYIEFNRLSRQTTREANVAGDNNLYFRLRAEQIDLLPAGATPKHYGLSR